MAKMPVSNVFAFLGVIIVFSLGIFYVPHSQSATPKPLNFQPYFSYSAQDIDSLNDMHSDQQITQEELNHWVQVVFDLVKQGIAEMDATRLYAYLFTAQRDAAALSFKVKKKLAGNLTAVSKGTICTLLPKKCALIPPAEESDSYSKAIAEMVLKNVKDRLDEENSMIDAHPKPTPPESWDQRKSYFGSNFGFQKTWLINTGNQFRPRPPEAYGDNQIIEQKKELLRILSSVTKDQLAAAQKWSAGYGTILTSGKWLEMAKNYMHAHQTSLENEILILSILAMGLNDATIACFDSKYTFWKMRPQMMFPDIKLNIQSSSSPSYPSGQATISMAAAIILHYYFPENKTKWDQTALEIAHSRLWGGVHFPIDDEDGRVLGKKIADWIVSKRVMPKSCV